MLVTGFQATLTPSASTTLSRAPPGARSRAMARVSTWIPLASKRANASAGTSNAPLVKTTTSRVQPRRTGNEVKRLHTPRQVAPTTVAHFPSVTVRALEDRASPRLFKSFDRQHLVDHADAKKDASRFDNPGRRRDVKGTAAPGDGLHTSVVHLDARVLLELLACDLAKRIGRSTITRDEVVNVNSGRVSPGAGVA